MADEVIVVDAMVVPPPAPLPFNDGVPDELLRIGAKPRFDGKTKKQRQPPFVFPPGVPPLDLQFEMAYGAPVNKWDAGARRYAQENPIVWVCIVMAAQREIAMGKKFSFKTLVENIRWTTVAGYDAANPYRIANGYTAYFARYFRHFFPIVENFVDFQETTEEV